MSMINLIKKINGCTHKLDSFIELTNLLENSIDRSNFGVFSKFHTKLISELLEIEDKSSPITQIQIFYLRQLTLIASTVAEKLFFNSKLSFRLIFSSKHELILKHIKFWLRISTSLQKNFNKINQTLSNKIVIVIAKQHTR